MKTLLQFKAKDGSDFFVEVDEPIAESTTRGGITESSHRGIVQAATDNFDDALKPLKEISNSIVNCIQDFAHAPNEIKVELGLKFTARAGIILTSLDSEANFKIVLTWKNNKSES